jgi:hypothetical protein
MLINHFIVTSQAHPTHTLIALCFTFFVSNGQLAVHQPDALFQPPFGCRKNGSAFPTGKSPAALQCYLMTSFLSEKIFYHGWTRIHTDWKEGSTMLDTNCANYR